MVDLTDRQRDKLEILAELANCQDTKTLINILLDTDKSNMGFKHGKK